MEKLEYKGFNGHIILLCKGHYKIKLGLIESLKMVWAIRCGYTYNKEDNSSLRYIMNTLYRILYPTITNHQHFQEKLHEALTSQLYYELSLIEKLINFYVNELQFLHIRDKISNNKWVTLIKLPKPKKQIFNRILNGNGRYDDYEKIEADN